MSKSIDIRLEQAGLSRVASQLKALALPSIRLVRRATQDELLPIGVSKLGGAPDLAPEVAWPTWNGMPLAFVAQINLAEVPILQEGISLLPSTGLLSFFSDAEQTALAGYDPAMRGGWRVLYDDGEVSRLQRHPVPATLLEDELPERYFTPCALTFSVSIMYPYVRSLPVEALHLSEQEFHAYWDVLSTLRQEDHEPRHHLLGYPDALQGDMQVESQLVSHGLYFGDGWPTDQTRVGQLLSGVQDWQLLLQLETDPEAEMEWGIEGRIYYWIQTQALQSRDFENVWCMTQWA